GKLDRNALPAPDMATPRATALVGPRTPTEELIAAVWRDVLGLEEVGIHDNFFALGGHSLLATQVVSRVRHLVERDLPLRLLFEAPTIASFAAQVTTQQAEAALPLVPLPRDGRPLPLSFAQQRLWFLDQLQPDSRAYHIPLVVRLHGTIDLTALQHSLTALVERHESLRTTVAVVDGQPIQVIAATHAVPLPVVDVPPLADPERETWISHLVRTEIAQPFDLAVGPLLRARLLRLADAEHLVILTLHHIISDGWSQSVLLRELTTLYRGYAQGEAVNLPPLPIQYADYAVWQRQWLQGSVLEQQLGYWRQQLADVSPLDLPTDYPRPPVTTAQGAQTSFVLPAPLTSALHRLSQELGATLFMTLLAAFQVLLARYSHQTDIAIGTPIAGRVRPELEDLIGFFVNTLVLRTDLAGQPTFVEVLRRVRATALQAYAQQDVPFELVVDALQPERDLSRTPLFQVMFILQNTPRTEISLPGLHLIPQAVETHTTKFDLTLILSETAEGVRGQVGYRTDLFATETIARLALHYQVLLEAVVSNPAQQINCLPLLTEPEQRHLLQQWDATASDYPTDSCLHDLVAAQAARTPDAVAVIFQDERLTYAELDRRANQLAHHLLQLGVGPETRVGLYLQRSIDLVVGLLGILKAGGAYVPIDPSYPQDRIQFMLHDSQAAVLVTQSSLASSLPEHTARLVCLDTDAATLAQASAANPPVTITPEHLAYLIYTSGTTGRPKAVLVEHRNLLNVLHASQQTFGYKSDDVQPWIASVAFDIALFELFNPLLAGGTTVVVGQYQALDGSRLLDGLAQWTVLHAVPSLLRQIVQTVTAEAAIRPVSSRLRLICVGGDAVPPELLADAQAAFPQAEIVVLYGPTEGTIICTHYVVPRSQRPTRQVIGYALPNMRVRLYDASRQLVPIGVPGELYIGGAGVTRGYLNQPDLTAEKFVTIDGERWYRSGDLARYLADGAIEFLGRTDAQVKIRGYRIEVGEIEAVVSQHAAVVEAVVMAREDTPGDKRLVAYIVPDPEQPPTVNELRRFLQAALPDYMVPAAFVVLGALPLTPNGKVDRNALPAPDMARPDLDQALVAPQTPLEQLLAGMWQDVLGLDAVGVHDNFFALGGNSIQAAIFVNKLQQALNEVVYVVAVFDAPTIAELARYLAKHTPKAVARISGTESATDAESAPTPTVDAALIAQMREVIAPLPPRPARAVRTKNPRAVFLLSPPRSGSTLLRVMLAGHPQLFAPPELELLSFNTLAERKTAFTGRDRFWLEGTVRAIMAIKGCDGPTAERIMADCEAQGLTVQEFYGLVQSWLGERLLVDKTPSYTLDPAILQRMEADFEQPLYIHLLRHPYGMIRSFEDARLDQVFFRHPHAFPTRTLAELIWNVSQQNIREFLTAIPAERQYRLRFEDLTAQPEALLHDLCRFLGLDFHPEMAQPYQDKQQRMTDGIHAMSKMLGDVKFHQHTGIDASVSDRWKQHYHQDFLGDLTWQLAESLSYARPAPEQSSGSTLMPIRSLPRDGSVPLPLSFAQQRLWFIHQLDPASSAYHVPVVVRVRGVLDAGAMQQALSALVARHESLRTVFAETDAQPVQVILPPLAVPLPVVELPADSPAVVRTLVEQAIDEPFDLAQGPLLRARLLRWQSEDARTEHVFVLVLHHIVSDGWSQGILIRELATLYQALVQHEQVDLPPLPIQYADYAVWQRQWLQGSVLEQQLGYWRQQLADVSPLDLPTDYPRPPVTTAQGAQTSFVLPAPLSSDLQRLSQRHGATLFMTLLAAFDVLLYRYSGQTDIAIGTPIAGRVRPELEDLIGFFVNTLVLRTDLAGQPTFVEVLRRVRTTALQAYAQQDVPFELVVDALQPERDLSRTPLFQVMFVLQNAPQTRIDLPELRLESAATEHHTAKFDLTLSVYETPNGLYVGMNYRADLFEAQTIGRMAEHFQMLLAAIVADPAQPIDRLPLLSSMEQERMLSAWNATASDYPTDRCLHDLVAAQATQIPEAIALLFQDEQLTYEDLDRRANQLAHHLHQLGVGPEARVGVCLPRSLDLIVAVLAVLKAGGGYVPLDPTYPQERLAFLLQDAQPTVLLTHESLLHPTGSRLPAFGGAIVCVDRDHAEVARWPITPPVTRVQPANLAYVIYTSGSTGRPKGVLVSHQAICNHLHWRQATYPLSAADRFLHKASFSFDISVWECFAPLIAGATLVLASDEERQSSQALVNLIADTHITMFHAGPALLRLLLDEPRIVACRAVRHVFCGGEPLSVELQQRCLELLPAMLHHQYGPTETCVDATIWTCERGSDAVMIPIGQPIANTQCYILDRHLRPVPVGVVGELFIGGVQLARGYHQRPNLTAERFVPHPFSDAPGERLYRTGDRARYRANGAIEFLGRLDEQVKLRGYRIELGEIEAVLRQHEAVRDTLVVLRDERLVAYVVENREPGTQNLDGELDGSRFLDAGRPLGMAPGSALREFLAQRLPDYMVPSAFMVLAALPLLPNGKRDRNALPAPDAPAEHGRAFVAPRTATEAIIAQVWTAVLGVEDISIHDNFFALGGHSLLAAQVVNRVRQLLSVDLPLRTLFEAPTIAALAGQIAEQAAAVDAPLVAVPRDGRPLPLSFAQQRLWFLEQLTPGDAIYHMPTVVRLVGVLAHEALQQALSALVARHESLRTSFVLRDEEPVQVIHASQDVALPLVEVPHDTDDATIRALVAQAIRKPFDLQQGPLIRAMLIRRSPAEHVLVLTLHHIVSDGWSQSILIQEVTTIYQALVQNRPVELPPLPIQYADYAVWQRQWLAGSHAQMAPGIASDSVVDAQLSYWRTQLADATLLELPTDYPRPLVMTAAGGVVSFQLGLEVSQVVQRLSRQQGTTLFMTLLAAFEVLLYRYSGQTDIAIGTPIAGRVRPELEDLIGFFVNTLVLRTDLSGAPSFTEVLARVRTTALDAYAQQDVPFELVVDALQPERDLSRTPLFQVMFVLQNTPRTTSELPDLAITPFRVESTTTKFDLSCVMTETAGGLVGSIEYRTDLFAAETITRMAEHFQMLLAAIVADPQQRIDCLPLLTEAERQQLLHTWNATAAEYPHALCLHTAIEAQVARRPDAIAVVYEDQALTYRELNDRANQLAHYLQSRGVGGRSNSEVRIGIMMEPSIEMIVGLLAILKVGGCYVPLDPHYPAERLRWLFGDSQIALVLTQQQHLAALPDPELPSLCLDRDWAHVAGCPTANLDLSCSPDQLAYLIYTSGSTGKPKGVMVAHRGVINNLAWRQETWPLSAEDRVLLNYSISFDPAVWNIFWPLSTGAQLVLVPSETRSDSAALVRMLAEHGVSVFGASPSQHAVLLEEPGLAACTRLRYVVSGGERLSGELAQRFMSRVSAILCNAYGPTEGTIDTTFWVCPRSDEPQTPLLGRPLPNVQVYVLDRRMQPLPIGVPGELYIGGVQLARGYLNRPELTAERFVPNPFSALSGGRLYRTGDLVRYQADGNLEFLGRIDEQVKLRGFRIELGEIEAVLKQHPAVHESVVVVREDQGRDPRLVAYVVTEPGSDEGESGRADVRAYLAERLPGYMVPSAVVLLHVLPLTANGKLDRQALPQPVWSGSPDTSGFAAPRTPTEELIAGVWAAVLGVEQISIHDNFFALGGHSLLATQVVARLRHLLEREIPLRLLFEAPTIAALASRIEGQAPAVTVPMVPVPRDGTPLPLSFAQQRLWFLHQLEPSSAAYAIPVVVRLIGTLDQAALARSLSTIVQRHEILRTTFTTDHTAANPVPYQQIAPPADLPLVLCSLPAHADAASTHSLVSAFIAQPFDLQQGPLLRTMLVQQHPDEHLLVLVIHHSIFDGWSQQILIEELTALYTGWVQQQPATLPSLPLQYADYAVWQRAWLQGSVLDQQLTYWRTQLADVAPLDLPTDYPRPSVAGTHGAHHSFGLPAALSQALQQLSQQEGTTLFMTLLAAWQVLLARYTSQDDIVVGSPIAGRVRPELEELIGFFVNTLVLRTDLGGHPTFAEVLARVRAVCLGAYAHQDVPFELVVDAVQSERDLSRTPLFQVFFALQNLPRTEISLPGLQLIPLSLGTHTAKFDLTLTLGETAEGLRGQVSYRTDLFAAATIERLIGHYQVLLAAVVSDPAQRIDRLPLLPHEERALLQKWNTTSMTPAPARWIHHLFAEQVARTPDAIALIHETTALTFRDLDRRSNQLAHHLRRLGIRQELLVAVCLEQSVDLIVALLAIFKAGGVYVPLDPAYPTDRLHWMFSDTQATVILCTSRQQISLPAHTAQVLCLDTHSLLIDQEPTTMPLSSVSGDNLAYVIYTSGSTGTPKGVSVAHAALVEHSVGIAQLYELSPQDRMLQFASPSFDASIDQILAPLISGACVVLRSSELWSPDEFTQVILQKGITVFNLPPVYYRAWMLALAEAETPFPQQLRMIIIGGEAFPVDIARLWQRLDHGATRLINGYGPTEAVVTATLYDLDAAGDTHGFLGSVPIGRTIVGRTAYVLDPAGAQVPIGVPGELYLGGSLLARGYLNRPDVTAERFVPDPFSGGFHGAGGARLYRTGDRARYLADGNIEFLGRLDDQVKLRGFRIELGEIEAVLRQHPAVHEAVVVVREDQPSAGGQADQRLVAYVIHETVGQDQSTDEPVVAASPPDLRAYLQAKLPDYMVPTAVVVLQALPLTTSGKLDRKALPVPELARAEDGFVAPRTPTEELIAGVWAAVLGVEQISIHDNFFALGGHSLLATQVVARLRHLLQRDLPLRRLFESPTIATFAAQIGSDSATQDLPLVAVPRDGTPLPLSFAQQRLWYLDQLYPHTALYSVPLAIRLHGPLDHAALEHSLSRLVARHEVLRTTFAYDPLHAAPDPYQQIAPPRPVPVPVIALPADLDETTLREMVQAEVMQPFDLRQGPLLRATLFQRSPSDQILALVLHHAIVDGWSQAVLLRELTTVYHSFRQGTAVDLAPLPVQYADYAVWQRQWLDERSEGGVLDQQLRYWRTQLAGLAPLDLPTDYPRSATLSHRGAVTGFHISPALAADVTRLSQQQGTTLFMTLLAAFQTLLARWSGQTDIAVGTPIAGRVRPELEGLIGLFVNTLVLRTNLSGAPSFAELLAQVRTMALDAYAHQDLPFELLVEQLQPERDLSRTPLFQVMFVLQNAPRLRVERGDLRWEPLTVESRMAKFDLTLMLTETSAGLQGAIEYRTDLFDAATIERMVGHFHMLLASIVADPTRPIDLLPLLTDAERQQLLVEWNKTEASYPADQTFHALVEAQAQRTPEAVAVISGDRHLTYGELNARANQLGRYLQRLGVGPEVRVGLCMERAPELVIGLLGILKAGGCYVPLDPSYPEERLAFLVADAQMPVVLTQQSLRERLPATDAQIVALDADAAQIAQERPDPVHSGVTPDNLAYIIYTSGSTGRPKGAMIPHRGLVNYLSWCTQAYHITEGSGTPVHSPIGFDLTVTSLFAPLITGQHVLLLDDRGPDSLSGALAPDAAFSLVKLTPAHVDLLNSVLPADTLAGRANALIIGGEALRAETVVAWREFAPQTRLINEYGPTETVVGCCVYEVPPTGEVPHVLPIGRPIA
ncbi:MAG TPA: non-ribosomal peptide synthase/polyketide synthase, partial [Herpetosiphonaceae bacterium]